MLSLALLLASWIGARAMLLEAADTKPGDAAQVQAAVSSSVPDQGDSLANAAALPSSAGQNLAARELLGAAPVGTAAASTPTPASSPAAAELPPVVLAPIAEPSPRVDPIAEPEVPNPFRGKPRLAGGHQLLWLAALAQLPLPPEATPEARAAPPKPKPKAQADGGRWSGDAWLLLRRGGSGAGPLGGAPASYGASQAGAVIRYSLAPASSLRPKAYLRVSSAARSPHDEEAAAGLSLRPIPGLPVAAMAELRVTRLAGGTVLRPAAMLVSEFAPVPLPGQFRAESYGAAGYVGGKFATPFADGQLRVERPVARFGPAELRVGGGLWGGVQKGASRLDAGPGATLGFPLGAGGGRLSADWRFRLAGSAAPDNGPALTISAGF